MTKHFLIIWIVLTCALCLIPSGWLTGLEALLVPVTKGNSQGAMFWHDAKEPIAHGILMLGFGYFLMRIFSARLVIILTDTHECYIDQPTSVTPLNCSLRKISQTNISWVCRSWIRCATATVFSVMMIAVAIEWAQDLLPSSFHRGYAWDDLAASLVGGSIGASLGIKWLLVGKDKNRSLYD